jgi:hypothetical protein
VASQAVQILASGVPIILKALFWPIRGIVTSVGGWFHEWYHHSCTHEWDNRNMQIKNSFAYKYLSTTGYFFYKSISFALLLCISFII